MKSKPTNCQAAAAVSSLGPVLARLCASAARQLAEDAECVSGVARHRRLMRAYLAQLRRGLHQAHQSALQCVEASYLRELEGRLLKVQSKTPSKAK